VLPILYNELWEKDTGETAGFCSVAVDTFFEIVYPLGKRVRRVYEKAKRKGDRSG
jgi:hypothetical protein